MFKYPEVSRVRFFFIFAAALLLFTAAPVKAVGLDDVRFISPAELKAMLDGGDRVVVLDARSRGAYETGTVRIPGDLRIPPDELENSLWQIPMGSAIVTYCT